MSDQFANVFDSLPGNFAARAKALVAKREMQGANVHFVNGDGQRDRRSFATATEAQSFKAQLHRAGRAIID
jgi:hypothetical protein